MTPNEYQDLAMRTAPKDISALDALLNTSLGLTGEAGEFADLIKKWKFQGHPFEGGHLAKELGDILWYVAMGCQALNISMEEVMMLNIAKLQKRYPEGFDTERSQHREEGDI